MSTQWSLPDEDQESVRPSVLVLSALAAAVITSVAYLVLLVVLLSVVFGTADYETGTPGPGGTLGAALLNLFIILCACTVGAWAGSRFGRLRSAPSRSAFLAAAGGAALPGLVSITSTAVTGDVPAIALLAGVVAVLVGSVAGGRRGSRASAGTS